MGDPHHAMASTPGHPWDLGSPLPHGSPPDLRGDHQPQPRRRSGAGQQRGDRVHADAAEQRRVQEGPEAYDGDAKDGVTGMVRVGEFRTPEP